MMKSYRRSIAFWLLAVLPLQFCVGEQPATRPNIVFIMVDDMGYRNLGCYGGKSIQTPNIDAMCQEGIRFTDCYSGASVCAPARSTLMTGYHLGHAPVRGNNGGTPLFPEDLTVAEILKKAGYLTGGFGKWGLGKQGSQGAAEKQGFDTFFGYSCGELKGIKGSSYEGGIRVPMVVRWPGKIKAGTVSDLPWYFPDVMPTLAELAGVSQKIPKDTDGISIIPTLLGKGEQQKHEYLFWSGAIRMGNWKGVGKPEKLALYDLSRDVGETNNLAGKYPGIVAKLSDLMQKAWSEPRSQQADGTYTGREEEH